MPGMPELRLENGLLNPKHPDVADFVEGNRPLSEQKGAEFDTKLPGQPSAIADLGARAAKSLLQGPVPASVHRLCDY